MLSSTESLLAVKPSWFARLPRIIADLEALPSPWINRGTIEVLLGVGPRRAEQILQPCAGARIGTSTLADRGCSSSI